MQTFASGHSNDLHNLTGQDVQKRFEIWNDTNQPNLEDTFGPTGQNFMTTDLNSFGELNGNGGVEQDLLFGILRGE